MEDVHVVWESTGEGVHVEVQGGKDGCVIDVTAGESDHRLPTVKMDPAFVLGKALTKI